MKGFLSACDESISSTKDPDDARGRNKRDAEKRLNLLSSQPLWCLCGTPRVGAARTEMHSCFSPQVLLRWDFQSLRRSGVGISFPLPLFVCVADESFPAFDLLIWGAWEASFGREIEFHPTRSKDHRGNRCLGLRSPVAGASRFRDAPGHVLLSSPLCRKGN